MKSDQMNAISSVVNGEIRVDLKVYYERETNMHNNVYLDVKTRLKVKWVS